MVEGSITNIALDGDKFIAYATVNSINEAMTFDSSVTAQDIKNWLQERIDFYNELIAKEEQLRQELVGVEWQ